MASQDLQRRVWDQLRQKVLRAFNALLPSELVLAAARIAIVLAGTGVPTWSIWSG
jgi:hypothetical protein